MKFLIKAEEKLEQTKQSLNASCESYKQVVMQANAFQTKYYLSTLPNILKVSSFLII